MSNPHLPPPPPGVVPDASAAPPPGSHSHLPQPPPLPYPPHMQQHVHQQPGPGSVSSSAGGPLGTASPAPDGGKTNGTAKGVKRTASEAIGVGGTKAGAAGGAGKDKGKEKKTRSKAACSACKSVKQKCEGPPYIPCRRCQLYKLECKFPPGTKTIPRPPDDPAANGASGSGQPPQVVTDKLYEIATRLQSIESALHIHRPRSPHGGVSHSSHSLHPASPSAHSSDAGHDDEDAEETSSVGKAVLAIANPMAEINATIESISGRPAPKMTQMELSDYGSPDVLRRGVLTPDECQQLFDFFFASLHPWIMMLSLDEDRNAMAVRQRSTLLFHTILLLSTAYSSPFPSQLHLTLVTFLNNIIAPQLINPQPHELNTDFLRTIDLLTLYKPVQFGARRAEGIDDSEAMRVSKVNGLASWMLQGIFSRAAERLELSSVVGKFARAYSASATGQPIPKELIRDLRLYYWLLSNDVHGNVQSGRRCNMEGAQALTTTRLFSSLQLQPYDVRLAASVEMFEVARPILRSYNYERTRKIPRPDLERFNQGMKTFDETWLPVLQRQLSVDPLAMTVLCPFASFIILQFNATCYVSWKSTRMYASSESGGDGRPGTGSSEGRNKRLRTDGPRGLTDWEFEGLTRCVKAAETLVFTLSEESRVPGAWRQVQWEEAERSDGWRKLVLDDQMVEQTRWGMDAVTCIAYVFPLVFLAKLVNEGLLTTNLTIIRRPTPQPAWLYTQKLPRLLELGAAFLDAIATNAHHPSRSQAHVLRTLLDTGIRGRIPTPTDAPPAYQTSPSAPRNAATVISPSPTVSSLPYIPPQPASYPDTVPPPGGWPGGPPGGPLQQPGYAFPPTNGTTPPGSVPAPPPGLVPGMDEALGTVLNDFEPLFGDANGAFWEWGFPPSAAGGSAGTPGGQPSFVGTPGGMEPGLNPVDWAGAINAQPHPHTFPQPQPPPTLIAQLCHVVVETSDGTQGNGVKLVDEEDKRIRERVKEVELKKVVFNRSRNPAGKGVFALSLLSSDLHNLALLYLFPVLNLDKVGDLEECAASSVGQQVRSLKLFLIDKAAFNSPYRTSYTRGQEVEVPAQLQAQLEALHSFPRVSSIADEYSHKQLASFYEKYRNTYIADESDEDDNPFKYLRRVRPERREKPECYPFYDLSDAEILDRVAFSSTPATPARITTWSFLDQQEDDLIPFFSLASPATDRDYLGKDRPDLRKALAALASLRTLHISTMDKDEVIAVHSSWLEPGIFASIITSLSLTLDHLDNSLVSFITLFPQLQHLEIRSFDFSTVGHDEDDEDEDDEADTEPHSLDHLLTLTLTLETLRETVAFLPVFRTLRLETFTLTITDESWDKKRTTARCSPGSSGGISACTSRR
ncbi:hypothetical protein JCM8547_009019 [Rhodosporidiobolus lusitaniae]